MSDPVDDVDDTMAANLDESAEDARGALGYSVTTEPRQRRPCGDKAGRWVVEFRDGSDDAPNATAAKCATCPAVVAILHPVGADPRRRVCAECQGRYNARRP